MKNQTLSEVYFQGWNLHNELDKLYTNRLNQVNMNIQELDIKKLEDQGFSNVEAGRDGYWFECDDYTYYVDSPGEDAEETLNMAELYSPCCGEYVDPDWMMCPKCYEHV